VAQVTSCVRESTLGGTTDIAEEQRPGGADLWTTRQLGVACGRAASRHLARIAARALFASRARVTAWVLQGPIPTGQWV
jgi:hypothetical protein